MAFSSPARAANDALVTAVTHHDYEAMEKALAAGADDLNRALQHACLAGAKGAAEWLVDRGARDWDWAVVGAARGGHIDILEWLWARGAEEANWACYWGARGGHLEVCKWALARGDVDVDWAHDAAADPSVRAFLRLARKSRRAPAGPA